MKIAIRNAILWLFSVLLAISLFSLVFGWRYGLESCVFVFRIAIMFALVPACLYLPVAIALRDAEEGRLRAIALIGTLIGPAFLASLRLIQMVRGNTLMWGSDLGAPGTASAIVLGFLVGTMTTAFYIIALKLIHLLAGSQN